MVVAASLWVLIAKAWSSAVVMLTKLAYHKQISELEHGVLHLDMLLYLIALL